MIYHSLNGMKITLIDLFPSLAGHIKVLGRGTTALFVLSMIPITLIMGKQILDLL